MVAGEMKQWLGFELDTVLRCAQELVSSEIPSVDLFLENRQEYRDIGKALIATALIPYEGEKRLERRNDRHEWLEYLFSHMVTTRESFEDTHVSFITFNYDRSVEHFFSKALTSSFGLKQAELQEMLEVVPIVHVHGLLGKLGCEPDARPFSPEVNETSIKIAAAGIKVTHEVGDGTAAEYEQAHDLLSRADAVYFLGFGYHQDNIRRLRAGTMKSYDCLAGTGLGLGAAERRKAAELVGGGILVDGPDNDCIAFLRNHLEY